MLSEIITYYSALRPLLLASGEHHGKLPTHQPINWRLVGSGLVQTPSSLGSPRLEQREGSGATTSRGDTSGRLSQLDTLWDLFGSVKEGDLMTELPWRFIQFRVTLHPILSLHMGVHLMRIDWTKTFVLGIRLRHTVHNSASSQLS